MSGLVIGVDEVGMGPWAGPMLVCAFAAPSESWTLEGIGDSKDLSEKELVVLSKTLMREHPNAFEVVWVSAEEIDTYGLGPMHLGAMERAVLQLIERVGIPDRVIVDGVKNPLLGAECYAEADATFPAVSAASIIAKVARDEYMVRQSLEYPGYGFERHVGYGTALHRAGLLAHGVCPLHRRSVKTIKKLLAKEVPCLAPGS